MLHNNVYNVATQEIRLMVQKTSPVLGPAMLWAAWKGGDDSGEVITALISLGGKPNQVRFAIKKRHFKSTSTVCFPNFLNEIKK
jgi:hypothetical protein